MHRNRICSFVPAAKNAFPTFCSGSLLIPNCISPIPTGRISTMLRWMPQSHPIAGESGALAAPASSWPRPRRLLDAQNPRDHGLGLVGVFAGGAAVAIIYGICCGHDRVFRRRLLGKFSTV